ncbi:MAG TPA: energy-coupling factor ABC transporter substrate-binding protein [Candidatus Egerieimonas faecigallinarum]|nr:energy-coupling factor ABC transporter substrate-binding protein [Candidatus Egerieimonas faecigallinarum]
MSKISKRGKLVIVLLLLCAVITVIPLLVIQNSEFGGADGAAEEAVTEIDPDYEAWASPVMEPPGGETESLLFCLQAGLGAGVFGFVLGRLIERKKHEKN